jgi:hypothetical protein
MTQALRLVARIVLLVVFGGGAITGGPAAAHASTERAGSAADASVLGFGGGCAIANRPNYQVGVCISESFGSAYGDFYIDFQNLRSWECALYTLMVWERNGVWHHPRAGKNYPCVVGETGHRGPISVSMSPGLRYYTRVCLYNATGAVHYCDRSPEVWR